MVVIGAVVVVVLVVVEPQATGITEATRSKPNNEKSLDGFNI